MAKKWIGRIGLKEDRLRKMLHKKEGEKITSAELDMLERRAKRIGGKAGKSLMGAVALARRFKSKEFKK